MTEVHIEGKGQAQTSGRKRAEGWRLPALLQEPGTVVSGVDGCRPEVLRDPARRERASKPHAGCGCVPKPSDVTRPTDAVDHIKNELTAFARLREGADAQPDQSAAYNPQEPQGLRLKDKEAALRQLWQEAEKNFRFEQARRRGLREAGGWIYLPEFEAPEFVWLLQAKGGREENRFGLRPPDNAFFGFVKALFELIFGLLFVFLEATTDAVKKTAGGGADNRDYNSGHDILSAVPG